MGNEVVTDFDCVEAVDPRDKPEDDGAVAAIAQKPIKRSIEGSVW